MFISLIVFIVILIYYRLKRSHEFWLKHGVTGPKPHILLGTYKEVIFRRLPTFEYLKDVYNQFPTEKIVGLYRYHTPSLLLRDLDVIQQIFIRQFDNFVNRGFEIGDKLSYNLASSADDAWRLLRTRLTPIFTSGKLRNMMYLIEKCGNQMTEYVDQIVSTQTEIDINDITRRFTVSSVSACAFGLDVDMTYNDEKLSRIERLIVTKFYGLELIFIMPKLIKKLGLNIVPREIADYFCNLVEMIVEQRNGMPSGRKDFMDLMLEMKNSTEIKGGQKRESDEVKVLKITDDLIAAQAMLFYSAGFETTATTLSFLLYELSKRQDIQEKMVEEINHVLENNNGVLNLDTLKQMTYMGQAFDETLRMYPIIDLQRRVSATSCKIPGTNTTVERGIDLFVPVKGIHYDEKYYPDPHIFDPDRFSAENVKCRHPCAYLPFGIGPRQCIGLRFAKAQSRLFLVKFLERYKVEPHASVTKFAYDPMKTIISVKGGVPLRISRR